MRIVFLGSPEEVISPLSHLLDTRKDFEVVAVVSQPAKPQGRGRSIEDPPVARFAKSRGILTLQPNKASDPEFLAKFRELQPDVAITAAYGQILSDEFLSIPRRGTINIHPSMLPAYRGATPVQSAVAAGDQKTGVTVLFTVKKLDAGNIIVQKPFDIGSDERAGTLMTRLFKASAVLLTDALDLLKDPEFKGTEQDPARITHCQKIDKTDGNIAWDRDSEEIYNRFRAFDPWPGSYTFLAGKRIAVTDMRPTKDLKTSQDPGEFMFDKKQHCLTVGTGTDPLQITMLKPAGGGAVNAAAFWNGLKDRSHPKFEEGGPQS
jgi:methionyl-tRNA formyltransferase